MAGTASSVSGWKGAERDRLGSVRCTRLAGNLHAFGRNPLITRISQAGNCARMWL